MAPSFTDFLGDQTEHSAAFVKMPFKTDKARWERKEKNKRALEQAMQSTPIRGRSEVKVNNGIVRFAPVLAGGRAFLIEGRDHNFVQQDRFAAFIAFLDSEIDAGTMDAALDPAGAPDAGETGGEAAPVKGAKPAAPAPVEPHKPKDGAGGAAAQPDKPKRGRKPKVAEPA